MGYSVVDTSVSPPRIEVPRAYNAAVDLVERHVLEGRGARIAVVDDEGETSYAALAERVARAGNALRALGVEAEQRVLLVLHDTVDFPSVFFGAMRIGAVPVPVNTLLTTDDYRGLLEDSRARAIVVSDALLPRVGPGLAGARHLRHVIVARSPLGDGTAHSHLALDALLADASPACAVADTTRDDVAFWLYSSGSTGAPKGALHLHAHLIQTAALYGRAVLGITDEDAVFSAARLFFAYGLGNAMTFPFSVGARAILCAARPTPASVMATLVRHRATIFGGVPTLFAAILADDTLPHTLPLLRCSISAGEALPRHVGERWKERFGTDILDGIGSTEMLHIFVSNTHDDVRYGSSGRPVPGYDVELRDDAGAALTDAEAEGTLWVRGPTSCVAYWNQRDRSLSTFVGPWTRTGDRYARSSDGYYTYAGRDDDMLKVGGIWVSPFEVESALGAHPAVLEAAVVGHGDADGLVKPKAYVVLRRSMPADDPSLEALCEELKAFVKARLAPYKYPRWIAIVKELPKTATGKIQRFKLRALANEK